MLNLFRSSPGRGGQPQPTTASKEDILRALEQFGGQRSRPHSNVGSRRSSASSQGSQGRIEDVMKVSSMNSSFSQSYGHTFDSDLEDFDSTSVSHSYSGEWERLFMRDDYLNKLRRYAVKGMLRSTRFRSVCWKLYLGVLPENRMLWLEETRRWRRRYEDLKTQLIINPRKTMDKADLSINNPLSQETESPWNQFFLDNELRLTIKQDVIRTYPKIEFFHTDHIRVMMVDALFIYAKVNPDVAYRQGMHELLAPLIFVLHCDHQAFQHACELESVQEITREILDPKFVEHDAYAMFCQIMETVEPWYVSKELSPTVKNNNVLRSQPFAKLQDLNPSNVIITKLTRIQDYLLKRFDPDLHAFLEKMDIPPQIYGIRWVRLLFGREFPMQDLLVLWDAIFADSISFDLVDYVFLAMLLYIRDHMLSSDYATCLTTLMKFPPVGDINYLIQKAFWLREPNLPKPPDYFYQKPPDVGYRGRPGTRGSAMVERATAMMSGLSSLTRKFSTGSGHRGSSRPKSLGVNSGGLSKSTSEPMNLLTDQSPDQPFIPPVVTKKRGSTASLSQIEDDRTFYPDLRGASSSTNLHRLETSSVRSAGSVGLHSPSDDNTSPPHYPQSSISHRVANRKKNRANSVKRSSASDQQDQDVQHQFEMSFLLGKLSEMEMMCKRCADKMDIHIGKLQGEMLRQDLENEDELLLSLAGLKQVRDVLKGILKPANIFHSDEIQIRDNHYRDEPCLSDWTPGSQHSKGSPPQLPDRQNAYPSSSVEMSSSPDSSSPEYQDGRQRGANSHEDDQPKQGDFSAKLRALRTKTEIEMKEVKMCKYSGVNNSRHVVPREDLDNGYYGNHRRSHSAGNHGILAPKPNYPQKMYEDYESKQNAGSSRYENMTRSAESYPYENSY